GRSRRSGLSRGGRVDELEDACTEKAPDSSSDTLIDEESPATSAFASTDSEKGPETTNTPSTSSRPTWLTTTSAEGSSCETVSEPDTTPSVVTTSPTTDMCAVETLTVRVFESEARTGADSARRSTATSAAVRVRIGA